MSIKFNADVNDYDEHIRSMLRAFNYGYKKDVSQTTIGCS